jgi:hypothetical protein
MLQQFFYSYAHHLIPIYITKISYKEDTRKGEDNIGNIGNGNTYENIMSIEPDSQSYQ